MTMTVNQKDYIVLQLLGKGKGDYSYLVTDGEQEYVLKQIHHEPCDYYQFGDKLASELRDYQILLEADYLVNAEESNYSPENIAAALKNIFRTQSGMRLLKEMYSF